MDILGELMDEDFVDRLERDFELRMADAARGAGEEGGGDNVEEDVLMGDAPPQPEEEEEEDEPLLTPKGTEMKGYSCMVCYDTYNTKSRMPKVFPCGHTFCLSCVRGLLSVRGGLLASSTVNCPTCRANTRIPTSIDAKKVPTNFSLLAMLEQRKEETTPQVKDRDVSECYECQYFFSGTELTLCSNDCQPGVEESLLKNLDSIKRPKVLLICRECIKKNHCRHNFVPFAKVAAQYEANNKILSAEEELRKALHHADDTLTQLGHTTKEVQEHRRRMVNAMVNIREEADHPNIYEYLSRFSTQLGSSNDLFRNMINELKQFETFSKGRIYRSFGLDCLRPLGHIPEKGTLQPKREASGRARYRLGEGFIREPQRAINAANAAVNNAVEMQQALEAIQVEHREQMRMLNARVAEARARRNLLPAARFPGPRRPAFLDNPPPAADPVVEAPVAPAPEVPAAVPVDPAAELAIEAPAQEVAAPEVQPPQAEALLAVAPPPQDVREAVPPPPGIVPDRDGVLFPAPQPIRIRPPIRNNRFGFLPALAEPIADGRAPFEPIVPRAAAGELNIRMELAGVRAAGAPIGEDVNAEADAVAQAVAGALEAFGPRGPDGVRQRNRVNVFVRGQEIPPLGRRGQRRQERRANRQLGADLQDAIAQNPIMAEFPIIQQAADALQNNREQLPDPFDDDMLPPPPQMARRRRDPAPREHNLREMFEALRDPIGRDAIFRNPPQRIPLRIPLEPVRPFDALDADIRRIRAQIADLEILFRNFDQEGLMRVRQAAQAEAARAAPPEQQGFVDQVVEGPLPLNVIPVDHPNRIPLLQADIDRLMPHLAAMVRNEAHAVAIAAGFEGPGEVILPPVLLPEAMPGRRDPHNALVEDLEAFLEELRALELDMLAAAQHRRQMGIVVERVAQVENDGQPGQMQMVMQRVAAPEEEMAQDVPEAAPQEAAPQEAALQEVAAEEAEIIPEGQEQPEEQPVQMEDEARGVRRAAVDDAVQGEPAPKRDRQ